MYEHLFLTYSGYVSIRNCLSKFEDHSCGIFICLSLYVSNYPSALDSPTQPTYLIYMAGVEPLANECVGAVGDGDGPCSAQLFASTCPSLGGQDGWAGAKRGKQSEVRGEKLPPLAQARPRMMI